MGEREHAAFDELQAQIEMLRERVMKRMRTLGFQTLDEDTISSVCFTICEIARDPMGLSWLDARVEEEDYRIVISNYEQYGRMFSQEITDLRRLLDAPPIRPDPRLDPEDNQHMHRKWVRYLFLMDEEALNEDV
jgi:hypothetical protein